jgi:uncharacterized protein (DUF58 family)
MVTSAPPREEARSRRAASAEVVLRRLDWHVVRRLDGLLQGNYRSLFTGHGFDLAEVREYQPEDDIRYMDWNVTARMDHPYVRQYIEEREVNAWLLLDLSPSVDFGTAQERKLDLVVDFAGVMARLLTRHGNRVGAMLFSRQVDEVLPPRGGELQTLRLIHQLLRPDRAASAGVTDLRAILDRAAETLKRRSLVFVVSDFIAEGGWEAPLARLAQRHEVLAVWLRDPREEEMPEIGPLFFEDAETGRQVYVDTSDRGFQTRFRALVRQRRETLERTFSRHGIAVLTLSTAGDLVNDIARFAHLRKESSRRAAGRTGGGIAR